MSYFKPPFDRDLTFENTPQSHFKINWDELNKHQKSLNYKNPSTDFINTHYNECEASTSNHTNLALLVREIGKLGNCGYSDNGTGTWMYTTDFYSTASLLMPNTTKTYVSPSGFYNWLLSDGIGLVYGASTNSGHFWIADGV